MGAGKPAGGLAPTSAGERAYQVLRERILHGELAPQQRLHQEGLSAELGVSRTPVREAIGRLAADGLVDLLPNRGARVADVRPEDMRAAYETRLIVEPAAAGLAAARANAKAIGAIRAAIAVHRAAGGDVPSAFAANRAFHLALVAAARNTYLLRVAEMLWAGRIGMRVYEEQRGSTDVIAADADQHEAIAAAVEAADARAAEELMRTHIETAKAELERQIEAG